MQSEQSDQLLPSSDLDSSTLPPCDRPKLDPAAAAQLLEQGGQALRYRRYEEAIAALDQFLAGSDEAYAGYPQAQMWQIKAYQGAGRLQEAAALCQQLTSTEHPTNRLWAQQFLALLVANLAEAQQLPGLEGMDLGIAPRH